MTSLSHSKAFLAVLVALSTLLAFEFAFRALFVFSDVDFHPDWATADIICNERFTIRMQLVLSSSVVGGDGLALDGCFAEGRAPCNVNLEASLSARSSCDCVVVGFFRVVLRVKLAALVGGIRVWLSRVDSARQV